MSNASAYEIQVTLNSGCIHTVTIKSLEEAKKLFELLQTAWQESKVTYYNVIGSEGWTLLSVKLEEISSLGMLQVDLENRTLQRRLLKAQVRYWEDQTKVEAWKGSSEEEDY